MQTSSQLVPTGARSVGRETRRRDNCRSYVLPNVRELPLRLEPVVADSFGGLVASHAASCAATTTINQQRRASHDVHQHPPCHHRDRRGRVPRDPGARVRDALLAAQHD